MGSEQALTGAPCWFSEGSQDSLTGLLFSFLPSTYALLKVKGICEGLKSLGAVPLVRLMVTVGCDRYMKCGL